MPALNYTPGLQPRSQESGRNFSIIFGIIAFLIVIGCIFWGFFLPKYRKKHPARPSSTRYNAHLQPQTFPSHPALFRGCCKKTSGQLHQYNPRTQTPFPNTPPPGDTMVLHSLTPRNPSAVDLGTLNMLDDIFLSAKDRLPSRRGLPGGAVASETSGDGGHLSISANDYILQVPEPMLLRPRSAGRAPTLAKKLSQFPMPRSSSAETAKLAHPRKLFEDLEQRHSKTTTTTSLGTPSPLPLNTERQIELVSKHLRSDRSLERAKQIGLIHNPSINVRPMSSRGDKSGVQSSISIETGEKKNRTRAGTITRPKTPVAEIRDIYDRKVKAESIKADSSLKSATISSIELPTDSTFSSCLHAGTPPTSPVQHQARSLNTMVTIEAKDGHRYRTIITPTPGKKRDESMQDSTNLSVLDRLAPMDTIPEGKKDGWDVGGQAKPTRSLIRPRPARLNLALTSQSPSLMKRAQRHSMSSLSNLLIPMSKSKRPSIQASSVYSRDTRGVSIARSPISPNFSEKALADADREKISFEPIARKASSLELLRSKIDNWNLHTAYLDFPTSPSSALKRALSDFGPKSPTLPALGRECTVCLGADDHGNMGSTIPKICIGRASDDIFRDPSPNIENGRNSSRVFDLEAETTTASLTRSASRGSAPGGAGWF